MQGLADVQGLADQITCCPSGVHALYMYIYDLFVNPMRITWATRLLECCSIARSWYWSAYASQGILDASNCVDNQICHLLAVLLPSDSAKTFMQVFGFFAVLPAMMLPRFRAMHRAALARQWKGILAVGSFIGLNIVLNNLSLVSSSSHPRSSQLLPAFLPTCWKVPLPVYLLAIAKV